MARRFMMLFVCVLLMGALVAGCAAEEEKTLAAACGGAGSTSATWGTALSMLCERYSTDIRVDVLPTKGRIEDIRLLNTGDAQIAAAYEWTLKMSREGADAFEDLGEMDVARLIYSYTNQVGHIWTLENSPIESWSYEDIEGKTVLTREIGSSGYIFTVQMLNAIGIDPEEDVKILNLNLADMVAAIFDGTGDICSSTQTVPTGTITEAFITKDCRFVPVTAEIIAAANEWHYLGSHLGAVPAGVYEGVDEPVPAAVIPSSFVARKDLDADIVYELVKLWWEHQDERNEMHPTLKREATPERLREMLETSPTPFHDGALEYYEEQGWA